MTSHDQCPATPTITPIMAAEKKAKPVKGSVVSMAADSITIKVKKEEKTFKITPKTKIIDKEGTKVAAADAKFEVAMVKADKADAGEHPSSRRG